MGYYVEQLLKIFEYPSVKLSKIDDMILQEGYTAESVVKEYDSEFALFPKAAALFRGKFLSEFWDQESYKSEIGEECSFRLFKQAEKEEDDRLDKNKEFLSSLGFDFLDTDGYLKYYSRSISFERFLDVFPGIFENMDFTNFTDPSDWMAAFADRVDKFTYGLSFYSGDYYYGDYDWAELTALQGLIFLTNYFIYKIEKENGKDDEDIEQILSNRSVYESFLARIMKKGFREYPYPENHLKNAKIIIDMGKDEYLWLKDYLKSLEEETNGDFKADAIVICPPMGLKDHAFNFVMMYQLGRVGAYWKEDEKESDSYKEMRAKYRDKIKAHFNYRCPVRKEYYKKTSEELNMYFPTDEEIEEKLAKFDV